MVQDDRALLARLRAGEEEAFDTLVNRYDASLRRVARAFVRTPSAADDVVQETWLAVIRGLDAIRGPLVPEHLDVQHPRQPRAHSRDP